MNEKELFEGLLAKKFPATPTTQPAPEPAPVVSGTPEEPLEQPVRVGIEEPKPPSPQETQDEIRSRQKATLEYQRAQKQALEKALVMVETRFPHIKRGEPNFYDKVRAYRNTVMQQQGLEIPVEDEEPPPAAQPKPMTAADVIRNQRERGDKANLTPVEYNQSPMDLPERTAGMLEVQRAEMGAGPTGRVLPPVPEGVDPKEFEKAFEERFTKARKRGQDREPALEAPADPFARIATAQRGMMVAPEGRTPTLADLERMEERRQLGVETQFGRRQVERGVDGEFFTTPGVEEVLGRTHYAMKDAFSSLLNADAGGFITNISGAYGEFYTGLVDILYGNEPVSVQRDKANAYAQQAMESARKSLLSMRSPRKGLHDLSGFLSVRHPGLGESLYDAVMDGSREMVSATRGSIAFVTQSAISGLDAVGIDGAQFLDPTYNIDAAMQVNQSQKFLGYVDTADETPLNERAYLFQLMTEAAREAPATLFELGLAIVTGGSSAPVTSGGQTLSQAMVKKAIKRQARLRATTFAITSAAEVGGRQFIDGYEDAVANGYSVEQALAKAHMEAATAYTVTAATEYIAGKFVLEKIPGFRKHLTYAAARIARKGLVAGATGATQEVIEEVVADALISYSRDEESMFDRLIEGDPETWNQIALIAGVGAVMDAPAGVIAGITDKKPSKQEVLAQLGELSLKEKKKRAEEYQKSIEFVENVEDSFDQFSDQELAQVAASGFEVAIGEDVKDLRITATGTNGVGYINRPVTPLEARIALTRRHGLQMEEADVRALQQTEPERPPAVRQKLGEKAEVTDKRQLREDARGTLEADVAFAGGDPLANMELREWVLDNPELARSIAEAPSPPSRSEMETLFNRKHKSNSGQARARFWAAVQSNVATLPEIDTTQEADAEASRVETEQAPQDPAGTLVEIGTEPTITEQPVTEEPEPEVQEPRQEEVVPVEETEISNAEAEELEREVVEAAAGPAAEEAGPDPELQRKNLTQNIRRAFANATRASEKSEQQRQRSANTASSVREDAAEAPEEVNHGQRVLDKLIEVVPQASLLFPQDRSAKDRAKGAAPARLGGDIDSLSNEELGLVFAALGLIETEGIDVKIGTSPKNERELEAAEFAKGLGVSVLFYEGGEGKTAGQYRNPNAIALRADSGTVPMEAVLLHELVHTWQGEAKPGDVARLFKALQRIAPEAMEKALRSWSAAYEARQLQSDSTGEQTASKPDDWMLAVEGPAMLAERIIEFIHADSAVIDELLREAPGPFIRFVQKLLEVLRLRQTVEQRLGPKNFELLKRLEAQSESDFSVRQKAEAARIYKQIFADLRQSERTITRDGNPTLNRDLDDTDKTVAGTTMMPPAVRPMQTALARFLRRPEYSGKKGTPIQDVERNFTASLKQEADWRNWNHFVDEIVARRTAENDGKQPKVVRATKEEVDTFLFATAPVIKQHAATEVAQSALQSGDQRFEMGVRVKAPVADIFDGTNDHFAQLVAGRFDSMTLTKEEIASTDTGKALTKHLTEQMGVDLDYEIRMTARMTDPKIVFEFSENRKPELRYTLETTFYVRTRTKGGEYDDFTSLKINDKLVERNRNQRLTLNMPDVVSLLGNDFVLHGNLDGELLNEFGGQLNVEDLDSRFGTDTLIDPNTNRPHQIEISFTAANAGMVAQFAPKNSTDFVDRSADSDTGIVVLAKDGYKSTHEIDLDNLRRANAYFTGGTFSGLFGELINALADTESPDFGKHLVQPKYANHWFDKPTKKMSPASAKAREYTEVMLTTYGLGTTTTYKSSHFGLVRADRGTLLVESDLDVKFTPTQIRTNLAGHIRYDIRTDADGNDVLFVGEMQSDYMKDRGLYGMDPRREDGVQSTYVDRKKMRIVTHGEVVSVMNMETGVAYNMSLAQAEVIADELGIDVSEVGDALIPIAIGLNDKSIARDPASTAHSAANQVGGAMRTQVLPAMDTPGMPPLPLLDKDHHERGLYGLLAKQIMKIAVQKGISRIAFAHGQQLDELWMVNLPPTPVAYEYDPSTESLRFIAISAFDEQDIADDPDKVTKDGLKELAKFKKAGMPKLVDQVRDSFAAPPLTVGGDRAAILSVPTNEKGQVRRQQMARAFKAEEESAKVTRPPVPDILIAQIADAINASEAGEIVSGVAMVSPDKDAAGKKMYRHSNLVGPQANRLRAIRKFFTSGDRQYATALSDEGGSTDHGILDSLLTGTGAPLDIYQLTDAARVDVEDSESGAYTIDFRPMPLNRDGESNDTTVEDGQYPDEVPDTPLGNSVLASANRLIGLDVEDEIQSDFENTFFVETRKDDLKARRSYVGNILFTATNSTVSVVKDAATKLTNAELVHRRIELEQDDADSRYWDSLPREYRKNKGEKFFELMDKVRVAPSEVDTNEETKNLPPKVRRALAHFKARGEDMRLEILRSKRDVIHRVYSGASKTLQDIVDAANDALPEGQKPWELKRLPRSGDPTKIRTYIIDSDGNRLLKTANNEAGDAASALAKLLYTDDWGHQYEHIHHAFFGEYQVGYIDEEKYLKARASGKTEYQARYDALVVTGHAATQADAAGMVKNIEDANKNNNDALRKDGKIVVAALPRIAVPSDVAVRLSSRQHAMLLDELAQAGDLTSQEIFDATRGIVGTRSSKNPFYGAMLQRTGKEGYSTDFWRVWQMQRRAHRRYMLAQDVRKIVFPRVDEMRAQGLHNWAKHFEDMASYIIYPASDEHAGPVEKWLDSSLEAMFGSATDKPNALMRLLRVNWEMGHRPTRRFLHLVRSFHYLTKLKTVRQHVVNSLQPLQTVWPIVGEVGFARAITLYNSKEGRRILKQFGPSADSSKYRDAPMGGGVSGVKALRSAQRAGRAVLNYVPYEVRSEVRNQNFAFLAMFDHAKRKLGMSDTQAAEFAMVRGVAMTQYAFTRTTQPYFLRSPIAATAFQFKRFLVNQVQLAHAMLHRGRRVDQEAGYNTTGMGAFSRFAAMQFLLGGVRGLVPLAFYEIGKSGFCAAFPETCQRYGTPTGRDDVEEFRLYLEELTGSRAIANTVAHGMFAGLLDIDISGSVALLDRPYGRNFAEILGNQFLGPAGTSGIRLATDLTEKTAVPVSTPERIFKSILDTSPALNQIRFIPDAWNSMCDYLDATQDMEASDRPYFNSQGEFQFNTTVEFTFKKMCGFRTMEETEISAAWAHQQAVMRLIDGVKDEAATYYAVRDMKTAREIVALHNAMYPELRISMRDLKARADNKREARRKPVGQRRVDNASTDVQRYMNRKYGGSR